MSDRVDGAFVAFESDVREDEIKPLLDAIRQLRGVAGVSTHIVTPEGYIAYTRVKNEYREKLIQMFYPMDRNG